MGGVLAKIGRLRRRTGSPRAGEEQLTETQQDMILREAVSHYIRTTHREDAVRSTCEDFIAAIDDSMRTDAAPPLPDVPGVSISPQGVIVPIGGATGKITVTITSPGVSGTWTVDKDSTADWLSYAPTTPQSADGTVDWTAAANTGAERTAHFYINGKTFTVDQKGLPV